MLNSQKFFKYIPFSQKIFTSYNFSKSFSGQRIGLTLGLASAIALSHHSVTLAQTAITGLTADYVNGESSNYSTTTANPCQAPYTTCGKNINMEFGVGATNDLTVTGFTSGAGSYSLVNLADDIEFRRIDNANVTGERQLMLFERDTSDTTGARIRSSYANSMEVGLLSDIANRGIDNAFSNDTSVASNNLERIDYIINSGIDVPTDVRDDIGFLILERGGNDPFKIAAITSLDAQGNPASFAPVKDVTATTWGTSGYSIQTSVMRREEGEPNFRPSHTVGNQDIDGIYISLSDLNVPADQPIYGYALFPNDTPDGSNSNDLVNLTGFPTDTSGGSGEGGLDLMAGGGIYLADSLNVVSGTLYEDTNSDNSFNNGEATLPNGIEVILYRDTNSNGEYDSGVDERVQTNSTARGNGGYNFIGVADGTYRVFVDTNDPDLPSNFVLGTPNNTEVVVSGSDRTGINFGFDPPFDYGDAPITYDDTADDNNTIDANDNPARHEIVSNLYLGSIAPDAETAPQSSANANGDDDATSPNVDDEDAFNTLPNVPSVGDYSLDVPVNTAGNATLHGWIDFDKDGKFEAGEYSSASVTSSGDIPLSWSVPAGTTPGDSYARFRLTSDTLTDDSTSGIDERSIGSASDGEVEDYPVTIELARIYDYGDAPDTGDGTGTGNYQTTSSDGGAAQVVINDPTTGKVLSLGENVDADSGDLENADALADDEDGTPDDEDGVASFPTLTTAEGQEYTVSVTAKNNITEEATNLGVPAYLVGFIDFNKDGDFTDPGERSQTVTISSGNSDLRTFDVTFNTPAGMTPGDTYARFRLGQVEATAQSATGASAGTDNGEVEDYQIAIAEPTSSGNGGVCTADYGLVYSGQNNQIFAVHVESGASLQLTDNALAIANGLSTDHVNRQVYYGEGNSLYAWSPLTNTHVLVDNNFSSYISPPPPNGFSISSGGAAFYNGSVYQGSDTGTFEIFKVDFVPGSNGLSIESITPIGIDDLVQNGTLTGSPNWGDFIIDDNGVITANGNGGEGYWSYDLNNNTFNDLNENFDTNSQLAKDGQGRLWALGAGDIFQVQVSGNSLIEVPDTRKDTTPHSSFDAAECVRGASSIGDFIWNDINGDGVQDSDEEGIENVTVDLIWDLDGNGVIDANEPVLGTRTTDANGNYDFDELIFGNYIIDVTDTNSVLSDSTLTTSTSTFAVNLAVEAIDFNDADFGYELLPLNPNLLLVKRITAVNPGSSDEVQFNSFVDDDSNNDNDPNWPTDDNNSKDIYLRGATSVADVQPGDEIEYTIYFLSNGDEATTNVKICDVIPDNMSFVANSYDDGSGIELLNSSASGATASNLSNAADPPDEGTFYAPGTAPPTVGDPAVNLCRKVDSTGNIISVGAAENINGAIVVEIESLPEVTSPGTPDNSYGFIRFRAKVK